MKIELRITRDDGRFLKYGESTAEGIPDSEIVLQTLLQHVQATATKVRVDMARGVQPVWQAPEVSIDVVLDQTLNQQEPRVVEVTGPVDDQRSQYVDDEPVTLDDDARLDELRAGTPLEYEEQDFADPTPPAEPVSDQTELGGAPRAPRTRPGRGRAVKDSPQA